MLTVLTVVMISTFSASPAPVEDYTFSYWMDGWQQESAQGEKRFCVQTNHYLFALDVAHAAVLYFDKQEAPAPYTQALVDSEMTMISTRETLLEFLLKTDQGDYTCNIAAFKELRLIENGRFLQRFDLPFTAQCRHDIQGKARKEIITGRLEISAWPDRITFYAEVNSDELPKQWGALKAVLLQKIPYSGNNCNSVVINQDCWDEEVPKGRVMYVFNQDGFLEAPESPVSILSPAGEVLPVIWEPKHGAYVINIPEEKWNLPQDLNHLERYTLQLKNLLDSPHTLQLIFAKEGSFSGITGMTPMLRDKNGEPTGIPVQISKNWHRKEGETQLYEGPWFHGSTFITLAPKKRWEGEFCITYGQWGGVPAVSHAQLCLIGWGVNQLWDQVAIGSWGESITYDPDINLNRSRIDDVRPLLVRNMGSDINKHGWTVNVGGGDFLVYEKDGKRIPMKRMRTAYLDYGPNLTDVIYAGITQDEGIEAQFRVSTPRCDDINRSYHRIRYDVRKETTFSRLAFYQVGADKYNDHQFGKISRGDGVAGHLETIDAPQGGKVYHRTGILCDGQDAWFSLHKGERNKNHAKGAWANRGMIIRSWKARLGGKDIPHPYAAIFGTDNGYPSANVELAPPPDLDTLLPGDFIEAEVELVIFPQFAEDYFGPNENLRAFLAQHPDSWEPVHREAAGNRLDITLEAGTLTRNYPVEINVDAQDKATFSINGGVGYVPVTLTGLQSSEGPKLYEVQDGKEVRINQSVHGSDFWQTGYNTVTKTWRVTYNLPLDSEGDARQTRRFRFHR